MLPVLIFLEKRGHVARRGSRLITHKSTLQKFRAPRGEKRVGAQPGTERGPQELVGCRGRAGSALRGQMEKRGGCGMYCRALMKNTDPCTFAQKAFTWAIPNLMP